MSALTKLGIEKQKIKKDKQYSQEQDQTKSAFGFQWARRDAYESDAVKKFGRQWLMERYCENDPSRLSTWLDGEPKIILDAGCGAAYSALLFFGDHLKNHDYLGVDISDAAFVAEERFKEQGYPGDFIKSSVTDLPLPENSVDMIFSEGVLHHTDNTENAFHYLVKFLKPGGRFLFYVYAKKAVIREFTDDHIRQQLQSLNDEQAWDALYSLTKLGISLGKLNIELDVPEDIPFLGIKKGKMDLQRFFYWNICKLYYRPEFDLDAMNHMNFDWFRPLNCFRHTPEEVTKWCKDAKLTIEHIDIQEAGISVVAIKD